MNLKEFAELCGLSTRTIQRYIKDGRLKPIAPTGVPRFRAEQVEEFSPSNNRGEGAKLRIPRVSDGLSPLAFARKTAFLRKLRSIKARGS